MVMHPEPLGQPCRLAHSPWLNAPLACEGHTVMGLDFRLQASQLFLDGPLGSAVAPNEALE